LGSWAGWVVVVVLLLFEGTEYGPLVGGVEEFDDDFEFAAVFDAVILSVVASEGVCLCEGAGGGVSEALFGEAAGAEVRMEWFSTMSSSLAPALTAS
jgi:hypothetical protein